MRMTSMVDRERLEELVATVARKAMVSRDMVVPFVDFTDFLANLLRTRVNGSKRLLVAGHLSADAAIAADRAEVPAVEEYGQSPFCCDPQVVLDRLESDDEIIYVANPNRVTGTNFGLADLEALAGAIPGGTLIVDEHFFDFYGITAVPLVDKYDNVFVIRSLTTPFGISSDESGYLVASPEDIRVLKEDGEWMNISSTVHKLLATTLANGEALSMRVKTVHDESLRLSTELTRRGIQVRINATDFLLLRVADPGRVCNFCSGFHVQLEDVSSYAELDKYVRYDIQSPFSNDNLMKAFERMPVDCYKTDTLDRRLLKLRRPGETVRREEAPTESPAFDRGKVQVQVPQKAPIGQ